MEISVLQSLIDRNSNEIFSMEEFVKYVEDSLRYCVGDELIDRKYTIKYYKSRLSKLRKIQKALKKEIAEELAFRRYIQKGE